MRQIQGLALAVCEDCYVDPISQLASVVNILSEIVTYGFPAMIPQLGVYAAFLRGAVDEQVNFVLESPAGDSVLSLIRVPHWHATGVGEMLAREPKVVFPVAGIYRARLFVADGPLLERPLLVRSQPVAGA